MALVEVQATATLGRFSVNERRMVDNEDPETQALLREGLLVEVNESTERTLAAHQGAKVTGCNCGS